MTTCSLHLQHQIRVNHTPRLLGVILDRSLTLNAHMKKLSASLISSLCILRAATHTSWDSHLKIAFHALICSKRNYASPVWKPWLFATNTSSLDRLQNCALRIVFGLLISTLLEALRLEADVHSYNTCNNWLILRAGETW